MENSVTILTPVYNRRTEIKNLYESLLAQTDGRFDWLIIDDGSTDGLSSDIDDMRKGAEFEIRYIYKENGGKHTALNIGFSRITAELTFIVDSDDMLTPDAVAQVTKEWERHKRKDIAGVVFLRGYSKSEVIGKRFPKEGIFNDIDVRCRMNVTGDKAEVWRTDILKQYSFPEHGGEKFIGESYIWHQIALKYDMYYKNRIIYIARYLEGGLTKSGRALRIRCPQGGMDNSKTAFDRRFPLKTRVKSAWLFVCYAKFAGIGMRETAVKSGHAALIISNYVFGVLLYLYWKRKYM